VPNSGQERPHSRAGREVSGGYNGLRLHCYRLFGGPRHVGGETYNKAVPLILHNDPLVVIMPVLLLPAVRAKILQPALGRPASCRRVLFHPSYRTPTSALFLISAGRLIQRSSGLFSRRKAKARLYLKTNEYWGTPVYNKSRKDGTQDHQK
jgi:hypothetical protein